MKNKLVSAFINSCHHVVSEIPQLLPIRTERNMVASSDLFSNGFKHLFCNAYLARDGTADARQLCTPARAPLRPRSWHPAPWPLYQTTSPSLVLGAGRTDHSPGPPQAVNRSASKKCIPRWLTPKPHLPGTDLPGGSILSPHVPKSCRLCHGVRDQTWGCWALFPLPAGWTSACLLPGDTA